MEIKIKSKKQQSITKECYYRVKNTTISKYKEKLVIANNLLSQGTNQSLGFASMVKITMRSRALERRLQRDLWQSLNCLSKLMVRTILRTSSVATSLKLMQSEQVSYETYCLISNEVLNNGRMQMFKSFVEHGVKDLTQSQKRKGSNLNGCRMNSLVTEYFW